MVERTSMPEAEQQEILTALQRRGVSERCPRCNRDEINLVRDEYFPAHCGPERVLTGAPSNHMLQCAAVVCGNCGFLSLHSLWHLGIR